LTVAIISPARTGANAGTVATVIASSMALARGDRGAVDLDEAIESPAWRLSGPVVGAI